MNQQDISECDQVIDVQTGPGVMCLFQECGYYLQGELSSINTFQSSHDGKRCPNSLKAFWAHFFVSTVKPFHLQFRTNLLHYITYWERFSVWVSLHPTALKFLSPCLSIFTTAGVFGVRRWPSALSHSIVQSSAGPLTVGGEVNSSFMSAFFLNDTKSWGITQDGYVCTNCLSFVPLSLFSCFQLLSWEVINQNHPLRQIDRQ